MNSWLDVAHGWTGKRCIVCGSITGNWVAPLGIVSGRVRCHISHDDVEISMAYFKWLDAQAAREAQPELPELS